MLDKSKNELIIDGCSIRLRYKLFQVLVRLYESPNSIIERERFIDEIWLGNYFTGPKGLNHTICHLRRLLLKLQLPLEIVTIHRKGYRIRPNTI